MDATQVAQLMSAVAAVLTLVITGLVFGWRRDRREAQKAQREAQDARLAVERATREAAAELRAETEFKEERRARPSAEWVRGPVPENGDQTYTFRIKNRGKVFADDVSVWLVDAFGSELGPRVAVDQMIEPGEVKEITLRVSADGEPPLRLFSSWRDTRGPHQRESRVGIPSRQGDTQGS